MNDKKNIENLHDIIRIKQRHYIATLWPEANPNHQSNNKVAIPKEICESELY